MRNFDMPEYALMGIKLYQGQSEETHRHMNPELLFVISGDLCVQAAEQTTMHAKDFLIISPFQAHELRAEWNTLYGCLHINRKVAKSLTDVDRIACSCQDSRENSFRIKK